MGLSRLTGSAAARYAAGMKDQWLKGLQWGGVAWLAWIAAKALLGVCHCAIEPGAYFAVSVGWLVERSIVAAAWSVALALTWTRWSRVGVGAAIVVQAIAGTAVATTYGGPIPIPWALTFWLPMSLLLLPLLVLGAHGTSSHGCSGALWAFS